MGLRDFDWTQLPEIPVDTGIRHGPFGEVKTVELFAGGERVGTINHVYESTDGFYAEGDWEFNSIKFLAERYPTTIEDFVYLHPDATKVPVDFRRHGPDPDTRGYRLLEEWEDDLDVPEYVLDAFREYLETGE